MSNSPPEWLEEGKNAPDRERFWITPCPQDRRLRRRPRGPVLDIGCGAHKQPGTIGVDQRRVPGVDVVCDFERGLPFEDSSIAGAIAISEWRRIMTVPYPNARGMMRAISAPVVDPPVPGPDTM